MFILLWMYLGGIICTLINVVELAIIRHYNLLKMFIMITLSIVWPITYLASIIIMIIDAIRGNKTEY